MTLPTPVASAPTTAGLAPPATPYRHRIALIVWIALAVAGTTKMTRYEFTPTAAADAAVASHGADRAIPHVAGTWSLVMVVHPLCPCSRASINNLTEFAARFHSRLKTTVVFSEPAGLDVDPETTPLWKSASEITGATLIRDRDAVMTHRLGARSSGQTFLYDPNRRLRFSGGITASRGQGGNNVGAEAMTALLTNADSVPTDSTSPVTAPVFGCETE